MCDPVSAGMFAVSAIGQVGQHNAKRQGVDARNRQRLKQFEYDNQNYINEVKLDNATYRNDVLANEVEEEGIFKAMVDQWTQQDQQLDQMFAEKSFKMQDAIIKMYENEWAGDQTGATAARLSMQSTKEKGYTVAKEMNELLLAKRETYLKKEGLANERMSKLDQLYEKVRHPPVPGHTPVPPELEAKPSSASLMLGLAGSALSSYGMHKSTNPPDTGMKLYNDPGDVTSGLADPNLGSNLSGIFDFPYSEESNLSGSFDTGIQ